MTSAGTARVCGYDVSGDNVCVVIMSPQSPVGARVCGACVWCVCVAQLGSSAFTQCSFMDSISSYSISSYSKQATREVLHLHIHQGHRPPTTIPPPCYPQSTSRAAAGGAQCHLLQSGRHDAPISALCHLLQSGRHDAPISAQVQMELDH